MNRRAVPKAAATACAAVAGGGLAAGRSEAAADTGAGPDGHGPAVVVVVSIHVKAGREEEFLRLITPVLDAMRHEATFINAALHQDPEDPTRLMLYETWADRDDLVEVQMKRDYRGAYEARLPAILREPRRAEGWRPLRGDFTFFAPARR